MLVLNQRCFQFRRNW